MKILHVIETLGRGGAEQSLVNLLPTLAAHGGGVEVAYLWGADTLSGDLERRDIRVHRLDVGRKWGLKSGARKLNALAQELGVDVVHSHLYFAGLYNALGTSQNDRFVRVASFHNLAYSADAERSAWKSGIRKLINRILLNRGLDGATAVSHAAAEHYKQHLKLQNIEVIPNALPELGVNAMDAGQRSELRQEILTDPEAAFMICPGRLVLEKGHVDLLKACRVLADRGLVFELHLVGDGPLKSEIERRIKELDLRSLVFLHAAVPQDELFAWVQAADCCVMSSVHEGFGLVAAEVMALGCPVVATAVGGLTDIIDSDEVGVLVPPSDPEAMATAVVNLLKDTELRQQMAKAARRSALERFSVSKVADQWMDYYGELIAAKKQMA